MNHESAMEDTKIGILGQETKGKEPHKTISRSTRELSGGTNKTDKTRLDAMR